MTDALAEQFSQDSGASLRCERPMGAEGRAAAAQARRVCFVANHSAAGGVGELWTDLALGLAERGYESSLVALWPLPHAARASDGTVPWRHILDAKPNSGFDLLKLQRQLAGFIQTTRPEWMVTAMPAANLLVPLTAGLTDKSIGVITSHHTPADALEGLLGRLDRHVGAMPNVHASVCVSRAVALSYSGLKNELSPKQRVIHNALPPRIETRLAALRRDRELSYKRDERLHVVALGRLSEQKNLDVLVRAAKRLDKVRISIVGGGPDEARLRSLVESEGVGDRVFLVGFVAREEALARAARADLFVQMSRFEGHSLALIEAATLGLPLIVSNIPAQVEGVTAENGDICGLLLDADDDRGLAEHIDRLNTDCQLYETMARRAARLAQESSFERMIECYKRLLA